MLRLGHAASKAVRRRCENRSRRQLQVATVDWGARVVGTQHGLHQTRRDKVTESSAGTAWQRRTTHCGCRQCTHPHTRTHTHTHTYTPAEGLIAGGWAANGALLCSNSSCCMYLCASVWDTRGLDSRARASFNCRAARSDSVAANLYDTAQDQQSDLRRDKACRVGHDELGCALVSTRYDARCRVLRFRCSVFTSLGALLLECAHVHAHSSAGK